MATRTAKADLLTEIRENYARGIERDRENRIEALDDLRFLRGRLEDQWDKDIDRKGRVTLVINRLPQFAKQVTGEMRQNKPEIRVLPVDDRSDKELAKVLSAIIRHIESGSDAHRVYVGAGEQAVHCGIGHYRLLTDYIDENSFDQDIIIKPIANPLSVVWDPDAVDPLKRDAKFCFVTELVNRKEFEKASPKVSLTDFDSGSEMTGLEHWRDGDQILIAEYWAKVENGKKLIGYLSDGSTREVPEGSTEGAGLQFDDGEVVTIDRIREVPRYEIHQFRCTGSDVIDAKPTVWPGKFIPIIRVVGEEMTVGGDIYRRGLIRPAKDSQRAYNYSRSAMIEHGALQPKAPFIGTAKMFEPFKAIWNQLNTKNLPYLPYEPDPKAPGQYPQRQAPPTVPAAMYQEAQIADADMKATTGIYDASLGQKSNETSGKAIQARQAEGDTGTFLYIDNLTAAIRFTGEQLIDLIPKIYTTERAIRMIGEDGKVEGFQRINQMVDGRVVNDLSAGCYDVEVTTGPAYATRRQQAADSLMAFLQAAPQAAPLIGDMIPAMMDWPMAEKAAERMKRALPPGIDPEVDQMRQEEQTKLQQEAGPQQPDPMQELQMRGAEAEVGIKEADRQIKQVEAATMTGQVEQLVGQLVEDRIAQLFGGQMPAQEIPPEMAEQGMMPDGVPVA